MGVTRSGRSLGRIATVAIAAVLAAAGMAMAGPATAGQASAGAASAELQGCANVGRAAHVGRISGVVHAKSVASSCPTVKTSDAANGTPPLIFHGGSVMGTRSTGAVVVTPIFWSPSGYSFDASYRSILTRYVAGVASDSGTRSNVYSTLTEYFGANGAIRYQVRLGTPISDAHAFPSHGCVVAGSDKVNIYSDGSGYSVCLDDNQIIAETERVVSAHGLPRDLAHIYVMYLPKHVESCFNAGTTATSSNACTINHQPSAAYCAYHSQTPASSVYANMPFPIYRSPVGFTCGTEKNFGAIQSPNGNPDADVEISPTSHEVMEAITDPDTATGWYDSSGYENGDECAYVFGPTSGTPGALYNQVIAGHQYLTQEEFSNRDFAVTGLGCLQHG